MTSSDLDKLLTMAGGLQPLTAALNTLGHNSLMVKNVQELRTHLRVVLGLPSEQRQDQDEEETI